MVDETATKHPRTLLTTIAAFIKDRQTGTLQEALNRYLADIGASHDVWTVDCPSGHQFDDVPCMEYEAGMQVAVAWLMQHIEDAERESGCA